MAEVVNDQLTCELARGENGGMTEMKYGVSADCRARSHNTVRAAEDRYKTGVKCTCPHALELLAARRARQAEYHTREERARNRMMALPKQRNCAEVTAPTPDFRNGYCTTPAGMPVARAVRDVMTLANIAAMEKAKAQCNEKCPLKVMCLSWVTAQEKPAGSWGGVWGGLDPWNRQGKTLTFIDGKAELIPYVND